MDWVEIKCSELIAIAKRSRWAKEIFSDARHFMAEGYVSDVALAMSMKYWLS